MTTLPEIGIADLPDVDDEVPCEAPVAPDCPRPAVWRCTVNCSACGRVDVDQLCDPHKATLTRLLPRLLSVCCDARPINVVWVSL